MVGLYYAIEGRDSAMKIISRTGISGFMELLVTVILAVECIALIGLPWILDLLLSFYRRIGRQINPDYRLALLILLYFTFACGLPFAWYVRRILRNINRNRPFIANNVRLLRTLSALSAVLSAGYLAACFFIFSFFIPLLFMLFAFMSLFLLVCSELFKQAMEYREENELTV